MNARSILARILGANPAAPPELEVVRLRREVAILEQANEFIHGEAAALVKENADLRELARFASFQERNAAHLTHVCDGAGDPTDLDERRDRFGEEALELFQSLGGTRAAARRLVEYVFSRPPGRPSQEFGGTMTTLAGLATYAAEDLLLCAEIELQRTWQPDVVRKIRRKRGNRHGRGPLPGDDADPSTRTPAPPVLFCVHVLGPDEIHPAPDYPTAIAWAKQFNAWIEVANLGKTADEVVLCYASVVEWDGTAESHAAELPESVARMTPRKAITPAAELARICPLPPGALAAYGQAYRDMPKASKFDAHVAGLRAVCDLAQRLALRTQMPGLVSPRPEPRTGDTADMVERTMVNGHD